MKKRGRVKARGKVKVVNRTKNKTHLINERLEKSGIVVTRKHFKSKEEKIAYDIGYDFAIKVYQKFQNVVKSIVLFGSQVKGSAKHKSDIDLIIIIDDCTVAWDEELIAWYREELAKIIVTQKYKKKIHVNTIRLSTWWDELMRGEPVVMNVIRYGVPLIDFGGFFTPLKILLEKGKIRPTAEAIYVALRRSPVHLARTKSSMLAAIEGLYWACVDSAHAALMAAGRSPPSPEHVPFLLHTTFVKEKKLNAHYVDFYRELYNLMHNILHGEIKKIEGKLIDNYTARVDDFVGEMARLVKEYEK
ncbi:MAG: nucleotidyltransferase domain-containing protein [Nanoarchaeota archaeon]